MDLSEYSDADRIMFSCEFDSKREHQQFVPVHAFGYIVSGGLQVTGDGRMQTFTEGDIAIFKANQLGRFIKKPSEKNSIFKSVNVFFDPVILQNFCVEFNVKAEKSYTGQNIRLLKPDVLLLDYFK